MSRPSNNSFKPNLLRYTNNMAGKACHVVGSATQVGLTQVLGAMRNIFAILALVTSACSAGSAVQKGLVADVEPIDVSSVEGNGLDVDERSRPYYECLDRQVQSLAASYSDASAAFEASKPACLREKATLYEQLLHLDWTRTDGATPSKEDQIEQARLLLRLYEFGFVSKFKDLYWHLK